MTADGVIRVLALAGLATFTALGLLHVYWALGRTRVSAAVVPTRTDGTAVMKPGPFASLVVALLLFAAALLLAERGGWGPGVVPPFWRTAGTAGVALAMLLRGIGDLRYVGLFRRVRGTAFARMDARYYTPLVLALAVIAGVVAAGGR